ncbi:MAG: phosphodiester glycosidase family protein, partial [Candidatus Delongbacteria bacterium]|nr:phosphodiester glycosidase family protein [Candidatus Delongbacteria bacterium]
PELALLMQQLGCCEAINLDGGGSTQIAVDRRLINRPEGGTYTRPVPTIWAVVHRDSLPQSVTIPEYLEEKIIDTGTQHPDTGYAEAIGSGWIETANNGYWGNTKSRLNAKGSGENQFRFIPVLTTTGWYEVFGWWVAASNRCTDTHILVIHDHQTDTLKVDQTTRHAQWASLGTYHFTAGDTSAGVIVTNYAPQSGLSNIYVVADAIRWAALSSTPVHEIQDRSGQNSGFSLIRSYPNPFQNYLTIEYQITRPGFYRLEIMNLLGQRVAQPAASRYHSVGRYQVVWDGMIDHSGQCASGLYFVKLSDGVSARICRILTLK